jgi:hypothetical protein
LDWEVLLTWEIKVMQATTQEKTIISAWLHGWGEINAEQNPPYVSCEKSGYPWIARPVAVTVPSGWHVGQSQDGALELYTQEGKHVQFVTVANHRKSVQVAWGDNYCWLAMGEADDVCCPTCGNPYA